MNVIKRIKVLSSALPLSISKIREVHIFLFCLLFLIFFRTEALFYPPYWDSVVGAFTQMAWLLENDFDYYSLAKQLEYARGGPRVYIFSIYPLFQAIFYKIIGYQKIFLLINHLLTIVLSSVIISIFYKIIKKYFDNYSSLIACALLFFHPLYISQSYAINMEIPVTLFGMLSVYFFLKNETVKTTVFLLISFYIKASGVVFSVSIATAYLFTDFKFKKNKKKIFFYILTWFL